MRKSARRLLLSVLGLTLMLLAQTFEKLEAATVATRVSTFMLANGLQVVVIPNHRAPVVTQYVWYRAGGADEPRGVSGIAHFLEHLMFKSTNNIGSGEFSKIVARMGGQDNAFTTQDYTGYFERIAKDRLPAVMRMEADRMVNLKLTEEEVATERAVILEERRSRVENNPAGILNEQMLATLYQNHPYGIPVIGWMHEMAKLSRADAIDFYKHHYAPNNAVLVIAGDVTLDEVKRLAEETFGAIPAKPDIAPRVRPSEPPARAARRVALADPRAGNASIRRYYLAPSYRTAGGNDAEALDLLMRIAGYGGTSRLYQALVVNDKVASNAGGWYVGWAYDNGSLGVHAVAAEGVGLDKVEAAMDRVLADLRQHGVTEAELERAKKNELADFVYQSDNQASLARRYGQGVILGMTIEQIEAWPSRIAKVTAADLQRVAAKYLDLRSSVTGTLTPAPPADENAVGTPPAEKKS
ncbi:MAG TPA: pitrilysin family protein [Hyphomicrobiaceae bacterium]|jgi:zinc protease|nr:pitrilysin family protein [Hyphomicrobiaceae bacterium]